MKYSIIQVRKMVTEIDGWIDQTEESLGNAEDADSPNEERIDKLNERLSSLEESMDALNAIK